MIAVCPDWAGQHDGRPIVLRDDGTPDGKVSHGMCAACETAMASAAVPVSTTADRDRLVARWLRRHV